MPQYGEHVDAIYPLEHLLLNFHVRDRDDELIAPAPVPFKSIWARLPKFHARKLRHLAPIITWLPKYNWRRDACVST